MEETHCYVYAIHNLQIMISNGGMMKCGGKYENVKLQMGNYRLISHLFDIEIDGCDVVLGTKCLCTSSHVTMDFRELYMSFTKEGHKNTLISL